MSNFDTQKFWVGVIVFAISFAIMYSLLSFTSWFGISYEDKDLFLNIVLTFRYKSLVKSGISAIVSLFISLFVVLVKLYNKEQ